MLSPRYPRNYTTPWGTTASSAKAVSALASEAAFQAARSSAPMRLRIARLGA